MSEVTFIGPGGREPRPRPLLRTSIGDVLRRTRQGQSRTLSEVALAARVSMPYLSEVERGRKEASSEVLATWPRFARPAPRFRRRGSGWTPPAPGFPRGGAVRVTSSAWPREPQAPINAFAFTLRLTTTRSASP